jgi:hypothetical protein
LFENEITTSIEILRNRSPKFIHGCDVDGKYGLERGTAIGPWSNIPEKMKKASP